MPRLSPLFAISAVSLLPACATLSSFGDPLGGVETIGDVDLEDGAGATQLVSTNQTIADVLSEVVAEEEEAPRRSGLFSLFRSPSQEVAEAAEPEQPSEDALTEVVEEAPAPTGFFARFRQTSAAPIETSDLPRVEEISAPQPTTASFAGGFLGLFGGSVQPLEAAPQEPETPLEFGMLRAACELKQRDLGAQIGQASGFKIYDTEPGGTTLRLHYITGFDDRCPRAFLGALVLMGDVGTHELTRYSRTRVRLDYSATDKAYEQIKGTVCRVGEGEPCGDRLERLGRNTTFVSTYRTFGTDAVWAEFLLHDGQVAATDLEGL